jgi:YD repeat-containing protein
MPTNVRTDDKNLVTQYCASTAVQPADPVLLKPKGDPGVALHFNTSTTLNNPAGTVFDHGTQVAHHESYLGAGKHAPVVLAGRHTGLVDGDTGFLSYAKTVYIEGRHAVMHGVDASVNALWSLLPTELQTTVENAGQIAGGLSTQDFADAAQEDAQALLAALKSTDTLIALAQTAALMGVSAIPVVGQIAGGAATAQRIKSAIEATAGAAEEFQAMLDRWTQPMSPVQLAAERKTLASFLLRVGLGALLAALGKVAPKLSPKAKGRENSTTTHEAGTKPTPRPTICACATGHPVIIATGEKSLAQTDFDLPGPIPIEWTRKYRSGLMAGRVNEGALAGGWFGPGWSAPLAVHLRLTAEAVVYHDAAGRPVDLPWIAVGAEHFDAYEQLTLRRPGEHDWRLVARDGRMQRFVRPREDWFDLPLAGVADRNGRLLRLHYGALPPSPFTPWRPQAIEDSAGRVLALEWSARGQLLAVQCRVIEERTDGSVEAWHTLSTYAYSEAGELIAQQNAQGAQRGYEWQGGVLVGYTLPDGARYRAEYDRYSIEGRVTRSWAEADGRGLRFEYDDRARCTRVSDALGRTTVYEYDERRDIVAIIGPDGQRQDTPFNHRGQPRSRTDALGRLTQYRFDVRGNLTDVVDAAGQLTQLAYNELDLPVRVTDRCSGAPAGSTTPWARCTRSPMPMVGTNGWSGMPKATWLRGPTARAGAVPCATMAWAASWRRPMRWVRKPATPGMQSAGCWRWQSPARPILSTHSARAAKPACTATPGAPKAGCWLTPTRWAPSPAGATTCTACRCSAPMPDATACITRTTRPAGWRRSSMRTARPRGSATTWPTG